MIKPEQIQTYLDEFYQKCSKNSIQGLSQFLVQKASDPQKSVQKIDNMTLIVVDIQRICDQLKGEHNEFPDDPLNDQNSGEGSLGAQLQQNSGSSSHFPASQQTNEPKIQEEFVQPKSKTIK